MGHTLYENHSSVHPDSPSQKPLHRKRTKRNIGRKGEAGLCTGLTLRTYSLFTVRPEFYWKEVTGENETGPNSNQRTEDE